MRSSFIGYFIVAVLLCVVSCSHGETYYKFASIPSNEWNKNHEICFSLDSSSINPSHSYAISLEITHSISYPYKNLFIYVDHSLQDSIRVRDTLECFVVDDFGKWYGSGNGATRQLSVLYKFNQKIDTALHNEICIRHAMQNLNLKGIEKIGLKVY